MSCKILLKAWRMEKKTTNCKHSLRYLARDSCLIHICWHMHATQQPWLLQASLNHGVLNTSDTLNTLFTKMDVWVFQLHLDQCFPFVMSCPKALSLGLRSGCCAPCLALTAHCHCPRQTSPCVALTFTIYKQKLRKDQGQLPSFQQAAFNNTC